MAAPSVNSSAANAASRILAAAGSVNATLAKNSPGILYHISGLNTVASVRYLKFYNKAALPVVGTDTPFLTFALPPSAAFHINFGKGIIFSKGIGYGMTTASADNSTAALTANDILGLNVVFT